MKIRTKQILIFCFWMLAAVILVIGVSQLFVLRFQRGDIYPVYSSLRADPLGTKIFYDSLAMQKHLNVHRNYTSFEQLNANTNQALIIPGASPLLAREQSLRSFVMQGGRLIMLFYPRHEDRLYFGNDEVTNPCNSSATNSVESAETTNACPLPTNTLTRSSVPYLSDGLELNRVPLTNNQYATCTIDAALPVELSCHTSLCFTNITNSWSVVYARDDSPVMIERKLGRGAVVISTLSFFISNEAMRDERHPRLLCWLLGDRTDIFFDEYHNHIRKSMHMVDFVKQYHLIWFGVVALLVALLYIWRNSCSLVPPQPDTPRSMQCELESVNDSFNGLINLLRRSIPRSKLLHTCLAEWKKSPRAEHTTTAHQLSQMESTIHNGSVADDQLVDHYNRCCELLKQRPSTRLAHTNNGTPGGNTHGH